MEPEARNSAVGWHWSTQFTTILVIYYCCNVLGLVVKDLQPMTQVVKGVGFSKTPSAQWCNFFNVPAQG